MPELPEVEHLRRTLTPRLIGRRVLRVDIRRRDVICMANTNAKRPTAARLRRGLLENQHINNLRRHGKQLALIAEAPPSTLLVQLGMTGQLVYVPAGCEPERADHIHVIWFLKSDPPGDRLVFRDPRRFGALTLYDSVELLEATNWARLGPDALTVRHRSLQSALNGTRRAVKTALLDQHITAGVGNIYADESLLLAGIHPLRVACSLDVDETRRLASSIRRILRRAIRAGGTTLRDYVDGNGRGGRNRPDLLAYARAGLPCRNCGSTLEHLVVSQRTTTFCPNCQPLDSSTVYPQPPEAEPCPDSVIRGARHRTAKPRRRRTVSTTKGR